jgi:parallel beta-helix repeat protein
MVRRRLFFGVWAFLLLVPVFSVVLNAPLVSGSGTIYIRADGSIDPPDVPIETYDNVTYTLTENVISNADGIVVERSSIIIDGHGYTVDGTEASNSKGMYLLECSNVTLKNIRITKFVLGVCLVNSSSNNISGNTFTDNGYGINIDSSSGNSIFGNNITNNDWGIWLMYSFNNTVSENDVIKNDSDGIKLFESSNNTMYGNNVIKNGMDGICFLESSNNHIVENNITSNNWRSIELSDSINNDISGNNLIAGSYILLSASNGNDISGNDITDSFPDGIVLDSSFNNTISENNITEIAFDGIWLKHSSYNRVLKNTFVGCGLEPYSPDPLFRDSYRCDNTVKDNIVNGKPLIYLENISDFTVKDGGQVILVNCSNILVENLNLSKASKGVQLWNTNNSIITNNIITNDLVCIDLCYSYNNTIFKNSIATDFRMGAFNLEFAVALDHSFNNSILRNNIANSSYGIWLQESSDNSISKNDIENNLYSGVSLEGASNSNSYNNRIYNNNFIASPNLFWDSGNFWDNSYPSGGNYWSDYAGNDLYRGAHQNETGSDGIGDIAYNADRYPLMAPFTTFDAGLWNEETYSVDLISNSTLSNFRLNITQKMLSFNVTGMEGNAGFCRIIIPNVIVEDLWQGSFTVLLNGKAWPFRNWTDAIYTYIYISYTHSDHEIVIVPEYSSTIIMPLLMILMTLAVVFANKRSRRRTEIYHQTLFF